MEERKNVVLVDFNDNEIGVCEKMEAHEKGLLHRAFSVFLFRGDELLLQKRASHKYHCGGLWTNTCCSHPAPSESVEDAAVKRLKEELDIDAKSISEIHSFVYRAAFDNGLTEYEFDHVLIGEYDGEFAMNPEEVDDVRWVNIGNLLADVCNNPQRYTPWFITALGEAVKNWRSA